MVMFFNEWQQPLLKALLPILIALKGTDFDVRLRLISVLIDGLPDAVLLWELLFRLKHEFFGHFSQINVSEVSLARDVLGVSHDIALVVEH